MSQGEQDIRAILSTKRYSSRSFPGYRFTPGRDPHPTASPHGHSYRAPGTPEERVDCPPPERWGSCEEYLYGCDLYNHGYWWEAHEAWEALWHVPEKGSVQKRFLQGIIQVAACHLKLLLGRRDGVVRLRASSQEHLRAAIQGIGGLRYMGLDVRAFQAGADAYLEARLVGMGRPVHEWERFPYIVLA